MTLHVPQDNSPIESQVVGSGTDPDVNADAAADDGIAADLQVLEGVNMDGTAYIDPEDVDQLEGITQTDVDEGETTAAQERMDASEAYDTLLEDDLRDGETDDAIEAIQEGLTYVPPIDPPVTPDTDDPEGARVATGFGLTAEDDLDEIQTLGDADDDLTARVQRALRDDSTTLHLARRLRIGVNDGVVLVRGEVDDLTDSDNILTVLGDVPGVDEVRDETTVRGL